jgi:galactokinase/mevalonate kinase-like predicted kinase
MIKSSAPGRAGIVGNPTDGYGGTVISISLDVRAQVELILADELVLEVCGEREVLHAPEELKLTGGFTDVAKAVLRTFPDAANSRFHLRATTDVPICAGLSGSTAMLVAILAAVLRLLEIPLNRYEIAEVARRIEFEVMKVVCGYQDQYMTVFGGLNCVDFRGKEPTAPTDDPIFATVEPLQPIAPLPPLVLANTGVRRVSGNVHRDLRQRWLQGDAAVVSGYHRIAQLAREAKKALMAADWEYLGAAMNENHAIQRDLGGSGEANEALIAAALAAGALGAKLAGAGQGGTIIALHPDPPTLTAALEAAGAVRLMPAIPGEGLVVETGY